MSASAFGYGIVTVPAPGVASADTAQSQKQAARGSVGFNGLFGIGRTAWVKTAGAGNIRRDTAPIKRDSEAKRPVKHPIKNASGHYLDPNAGDARAFNLRRLRTRSSFSRSKERQTVEARPMTTMSRPGLTFPGTIASTQARRRRRARLRVTALPTFRLVVNPTRTNPSPDSPCRRSRTCTTIPGIAHFRLAAAAAKKSARRLMRRGLFSGGFGVIRRGDNRHALSGKALAALAATVREYTAATNRRHAVTEAVTALADKLARLIRAFHGSSPLKTGGGIRVGVAQVNGPFAGLCGKYFELFLKITGT